MMPKKTHTCSDYREEMRLLGLKKRLNENKRIVTFRKLVFEFGYYLEFEYWDLGF